MSVIHNLFGYSQLGFLNRVFLQWFFIRMYRYDHKEKQRRTIKTHRDYGILYWVIPLTGWGNPLKPLGLMKKKVLLSRCVDVEKIKECIALFCEDGEFESIIASSISISTEYIRIRDIFDLHGRRFTDIICTPDWQERCKSQWILEKYKYAFNNLKQRQPELFTKE